MAEVLWVSNGRDKTDKQRELEGLVESWIPVRNGELGSGEMRRE
jgi:hypothetical protein